MKFPIHLATGRRGARPIAIRKRARARIAAQAVGQPISGMPPISRRLRKFHGFRAVLLGFTQTSRKAGKNRVLFKEAV